MFRRAVKVVILAVLVVALMNSFDQPSPMNIHDTSYDIKPLAAPRVAGMALRLFAWIIERSPLRNPILGQLMVDNGYNTIHDFVAAIPRTTPIFYPLRPVTDDELARHQSYASAFDVKAFISSTHDVATTKASGDHHYWTVSEYIAAYTHGRITPTQVAERIIAAIHTDNAATPPLRAIIQMNEADIRAQAAASTARWAAGTPLGHFDGVPVAVKDEMDQQGYATSVGTTWMGSVLGVAKHDATCVGKMRREGALLIGKANMHEIGIGTTGANPHYGFTRNPYNTSHYTGGSSSGSATSVSSGLVPIAIGADGGGSIRVPAALTGVVGLKATYGRISEAGAAPLAWTIGHFGPMAANVRDVALAYVTVAGRDPHDINTMSQPPHHVHGFNDVKDLTDLRIGVFWPYFNDAHREVVIACDTLVRGLVARGATIVNISMPHLATADRSHKITILSEMTTAMAPWMAEHAHEFALDSRISLSVGRFFTNRDYVAANRVRAWMINHWSSHIWSSVDTVILPTTGITAPVIPADALPDGESNLPVVADLMRFIFHGNFQGYPAIAVPAGFDSTGLPISIQVMADHWNEHIILRTAHTIEHIRNGDGAVRRQPERFYSILDQSGAIDKADA